MARVLLIARVTRLAAAAVVVVATGSAPVHATARPAEPADLVTAALAARLGKDTEISVTLTGLPAGAGPFVEARLDPAARLGRPMIVRLVPASGRAQVAVTVVARVIAPQVVSTRAIERGRLLSADDVTVVRGEVKDAPLRTLPALADVTGGRALRPIAPGTVILAGAVHMRRAVEPGDSITAVFATGDIEVTATLVAADGGRVGDRIRLVNPGTKRTLVGRVVAAKTVEVTHGR
jgi:flagella basal body P-ring formation protein FlgA